MEVLVTGCQHVVTKKAYAIASLYHSLCNDRLTSLITQVFDECLEAEAHHLKTEKRSIEIVIRSQEYKIPKVIQEDPKFAKYMRGGQKKLLYMKHITCAIEQQKLLDDLIKACYPTLRRVLGYNTISFIPIGKSPHMPSIKELKAHISDHMGYIFATKILVLNGLDDPYKPLKLRTTENRAFEGGRQMTTATFLRMIGIGDFDASNAQANLAISICPILSGKNAGSTHLVYTNDEKGAINRGKRCLTDGPRVEVVQSIKKSAITRISVYLEQVHHICPNDIFKVRGTTSTLLLS